MPKCRDVHDALFFAFFVFSLWLALREGITWLTLFLCHNLWELSTKASPNPSPTSLTVRPLPRYLWSTSNLAKTPFSYHSQHAHNAYHTMIITLIFFMCIHNICLLLLFHGMLTHKCEENLSYDPIKSEEPHEVISFTKWNISSRNACMITHMFPFLMQDF